MMSDFLNQFTEDESKLAVLIAKQLYEEGDSSLLRSLYANDYDEIPVSIDEFLENEDYLGKVFNQGKLIYPFWRNQLHNIYHNNPDKSWEVCLSGDTVIPLLDGSHPTIRELAESDDKKRYLYSYDLDRGEYTVGKTTDIWSNGVKPVYKITLDNGESVKLTSNHRLLTRDKHWKSIDSGLSVGDSLMPFNTVVDNYGYEKVRQPLLDGTYFDDLTHQIVARWKYGYSGSVPKDKAIHHKNFKKRDNSPSNLLLAEKTKHILYHANHINEYLVENYEEWYSKVCKGISKYIEENPTAMSERSRAYWDSLPEEEKSLRIAQWREGCHDWKSTSRGKEVAIKNLSIWNDKLVDNTSIEYKKSLEYAMKGTLIRWSDTSQRKRAADRMRANNLDPEYQRKVQDGRKLKGYNTESLRIREYNSNPANQRKNRRSKCLSQLNKLSSVDSVTADNYRELLESLGSKYKPTLSFIEEEFESFDNAMILARSYNHKIVSIEFVGEEEVFDISVEGTHNFAIGAGVVAHNCVTGAIGLGKSTIAAISLMYSLYRTLCLKNPQEFYNITQNAPIVFVCLNLTIDLAYSGLYSMIVEAIRLSPWFCERVDIRGKYEYSISFPKNIQLICGSNTSHTIGKNVLFAILDEVNFRNAPKGSKNNILDIYRGIRRRMESRFLRQGRIPGLLWLVSSKNSDQDFMDQYIQSLKFNKSTIVIDKAVYEVKPPDTYTGEKFKVAVGDKSKESKIVTKDDDVEDLVNKGYRIIEVPVEYKVAFEQDINEALKDISGISSVSSSKLIPYAGKIELCFDSKRRSPFYAEEFQLGLDSVEDIRDFLDDLSILKRDLDKPRFAHIDIGLKGDRLGLGIVHSSKEITVDRYTATGAIDRVSENIYDIDLLLTIRAIPGSEVPLYKIREFLLWLNSNIGYKFKKVTYDGFQSADSIQLLQMSGIPAGLLSVDRTDVPYLNLRACILEQRLVGYYNSIVLEELRDLEYDRKAKKVDHPIVKYDGSPGSKDTSDALCGAVYNAQEYYAKKKGSHITQKTNVNAAINAIQRINNLRKVREESEDDWILRD